MNEKQKNNLVWLIIIIPLIICIFIGGWLLGNKAALEENSQEETITENDENNEEETETLTEDDEYILNILANTYTGEERLEFLNCTNSGTYISKLFTNDITNSEKLIIGLSFFLIYHNADNGEDNLIFEKYAYSDSKMTLSKSTIEKIITRYFAEYTYEPFANQNLYLRGTDIETCTTETCTIKLEIWGDVGMIDEYLTQVISSNDTEVNLSTLYISYNAEKSSNSDDDVFYYNLYSDHKEGTLLKEGIKEPSSSNDWNNYFFSLVEGKTINYKFTFNEQKQLLKVEEL